MRKNSFLSTSSLIKRTAISFVLALGLSFQFVQVASAAGSAYFSFQPSGGTHKKGTTFTLAVHEYSTDVINAVEADLQYDKSKLQFISTSTSGSAFDWLKDNGSGGGVVKMAAAKFNTGLTGDQKIYSVTFKALAGSGTSAIKYISDGNNGSQIVRQSDTTDVWNHDTNGTTVAFTGGSTTTTPATNPTPTGSTSNNTSSKTSSSSKSTSTAKKTSQTSNKTSSPIGYLVAIKVTDDNKKPVKGALVTLDGKPPIKYDDGGIASFVGIAAGGHMVTVTANGKKITKQIYVIEGNPDTVQQFDIALSSGTSAAIKPVLAILLALLILVLFVGGGKGLGKIIKEKNELARHFPSTTAASHATVEMPVKEASVINVSDKPIKADETIGKVVEPKVDGEKLTNSTRSWNDQKAHNG